MVMSSLESPDPDRVEALLVRTKRRSAQLRRRRWAVGVAPAVVAVAIAGAIIPFGRGPTGRSATRLHGVAAVRAKLLSALTDAGNDIVRIEATSTSGASGSSPCTSTRWTYPFDVQPGGTFQALAEGPGCPGPGVFEDAVDISSVTSVTPYSLPTPSSVGALRVPVWRVGASVCGTGTESGFSTTNATPTNTWWQSSAETLRTPAAATSELLRSEFEASSLQLVGNGTLNGTPAVELSLLLPPASQIDVGSLSVKLWLDPTTYLPIREVMQGQNKQLRGAPPVGTYELEQDFTFLPPTPANVALLKVSVPAGLTQTSVPGGSEVPSCSSPFAGGPAPSDGASGSSSTGASGK
jgi:hypothetical protein